MPSTYVPQSLYSIHLESRGMLRITQSLSLMADMSRVVLRSVTRLGDSIENRQMPINGSSWGWRTYEECIPESRTLFAQGAAEMEMRFQAV